MAKDAIGAIVDEFTDDSNNGGGDAGGDHGGVPSAANDDRINGYTAITPTAAGIGSDTGSRTGRRGRPRGSRNANSGGATRATGSKGNISALENILTSLHFFGAVIMSTPELELSDDETKKLAASLARVSSLYDDKINPKLVAWVDVVCVAGAIYGPRAIAISARMKTEQTTRPAPVPINVARERAAPTPPKSAQAEPRSPVEMFGPEFSGAVIPDAV